MSSAFTQLKTPQSSRHPVQTPSEISEARLRTGMDLEAPHAPPVFEISQDWAVAQSAVPAFLQANPASIAVPAAVLHKRHRGGTPLPGGRDGLARLFRVSRSVVDQPPVPVATPTTTVAIETTMPPHFTHSVP